MEVKEYAVRLIADVKQFNQNMKNAQQELTLTQNVAARFSRAMERSLTSSNPAARKLGQEMQSLSQQYRANQEEFSRLGRTVAEYGEKLEALQSTHAKQQADLQRTRQELEALEEAAKKAAGVQAEMQNQPAVRASVWERVNKEAESAAAAVEECRARLEAQQNTLDSTERLMSMYSDSTRTAANEAVAVGEQLSAVGTEMRRLSGASEGMTKIGTFLTAMGTKTALLAVKFVELGKAVGKKAVDGFTQFISKAREAHHQSNVINSAVSKLAGTVNSFGHLLVRRFKRQIITQIYNGLQEGIQNVARESVRFNAAISGMGSAFKTLGNAIASVVEPLVSALAPAFTHVINIVTAATDKVAQFVAVLTGNNTYMKARKVQYDYAASLDKTSQNATKASKATQKATDATKKYNRTVMSFDELHNLNDKSDNAKNDASATDTSSSVETPELKFDTKKANAFSDFAKKLRNAFKAGDWKKLGATMAQGVNSAFAWVDKVISWKNAGEKITEVCNAICETINWSLIGTTIADGVNTIINTLRLLQTGIDWNAIGAGFGTLTRSIFETVDWNQFGTALIEGIQIPIRLLQGFLETPGLFEAAGTAFRNGIAGIIDGLDSDLIGTTLADFVNGIQTIIAEGFSDIEKWKELGTKLAENVNSAFSNWNTDSFGEAATNLVNALLSSIVSFIATVDWYQIGTKITEAISKIDWSALADTVFEGIGAAFGGFATFLQGIADTLTNGVKEYFGGKITEWQEQGGSLVGGILYGIISALFDIGNWISEHIFKPIFRGIAKAFGIEVGESTEMSGQGENIVLGLLKGIVDGLKGIGKWVKENIFDKIWHGIETAFGIAGDTVKTFVDFGKSIIDNLKSGFDEKVDSVVNFFTGLPDKFIGAVKDGWENLKKLGSDIMANIWAGLTSFDLTLPHITMTGSWNLDPFNFSMPSFGIEWYAKGGFPEDGLFMANHGELVGQFSNGKTAVANNEQIIDGIKFGVADAIAPFIFEVISAINAQGGEQVINIDGDTLATIVTRRQEENAKRYVSRR